VGTRTIKPTSSRKTLANRLSVLSSMMHTAVEWKRLDAMPCRIRLPKLDTQRAPTFYDHETYERLVEGAKACDPQVLALVLLAGDGGLRRGEIIGLDLADVDFRGGRFTPRRSVYWKKRVRHEDEVKGLDAKPVPCTPRLLDALKACRHLRGSRVLYTADARELTPKLVKLWVMRAERRAGLPETGPIPYRCWISTGPRIRSSPTAFKHRRWPHSTRRTGARRRTHPPRSRQAVAIPPA
jgi:integrase